MANEAWIKVRTKLKDDGRLLIVARKCNAESVTAFGALVTLWAYADDHADEHGVLFGWTPEDVDKRCGLPGFAEALPKEWIDLTGEWVKLPEYQEHNGSTAKSRAQTRKRVQRHRCNAPSVTGCNGASVTTSTLISSSDLSTEGTDQETDSPPPDLPKHFDPERHCLSSGRYALRKYPFVYIHQHELEDALEQWEREGLSREDWRDALKRANVQLERKQHARDLTGGMAYSYLTGHLRDEAIKRAKERERLGQAKNGKGKPRTVAERNAEILKQWEERDGQQSDPDTFEADFAVVE